eukprot:COSAG05_NODE_5404_length_1186_cov_0.883165_1_plen_105_part_10
MTTRGAKKEDGGGAGGVDDVNEGKDSPGQLRGQSPQVKPAIALGGSGSNHGELDSPCQQNAAQPIPSSSSSSSLSSVAAAAAAAAAAEEIGSRVGWSRYSCNHRA